MAVCIAVSSLKISGLANSFISILIKSLGIEPKKNHFKLYRMASGKDRATTTRDHVMPLWQFQISTLLLILAVPWES